MKMERDFTKDLSRFCAELKYSDLSKKTIETIKLFILDYYAAAFAGYRVNKQFNEACQRLYFEMGGKEESEVLFSDKRLPAENAAFINAVYAHGADMDDGNRKAMGHVGAHVMPAVFALCDAIGESRKERIYEAIVVGYEIYCRCAAAVQPGLVKRGFHSTGTAGVLAAAGASAKLMGLDAEGIYNSIALATTQGAGLLIVAESGQECKPINPARAAQNGIASAKLVSFGVQSFDRPLDSEKGWFHAMSDVVDVDMLKLDKTKLAIDECYIKPYPSCRHTHCAIEAARELYEKEGVRAENIKSARLYIYPNAISIAGQILYPQTDADAKFSIHYCLAKTLERGNYTLSDLEVKNIPPKTKSLIEKIELIPDESMENRSLGIRGAKLELELLDGRVLEKSITVPKGDPENPMQLKDVCDKLYSMAEGVWTREKVSELIEGIVK